MSVLKEIEWKHINEMILSLYYSDDLMEFERNVLNQIKSLVPYDRANFRVVDIENRKPIREKTTFVNTDEKMQDIFFDYIAVERNYLKNLFDSSHSVVYIDSSILDIEIRKNTPFYINFLKPQNVPHAAGIIFIKDGVLLGALSLFRSGQWGDFTDKEAYVLDILKDHLCSILAQVHMENHHKHLSSDRMKFLDMYAFTSREKEILSLILDGYSNDNISENLGISVSTTKKHVYNIFMKTSVKSRMELIRLYSKA